MFKIIKDAVSGALGAGIAALAASACAWFMGWWPAIWRWVTSGMATMWDWLTGPVAVPMWLLLIGATTLAAFAFILFVMRAAEVSDVQRDAINPVERMSDIEQLLFRVFIHTDGKWLRLADLTQKTGCPNLVIEHALTQLMQKGMIMDTLNQIDGPSFRLSSMGVDVGVRQNLITAPPNAFPH